MNIMMKYIKYCANTNTVYYYTMKHGGNWPRFT